MKKLVIATTNAGKLEEIMAIMAEMNLTGVQVLSLKDYAIDEPDEPYDDFIQNARHKAKYYGTHTKCLTLADDTGLCVEALQGFPGVRSKDFIQECGGPAAAFIELEKKLASTDNARAYFETALALYNPDRDTFIDYQWKLPGTLSFPPRGRDGFGFQPIFIPDGFTTIFIPKGMGQTMAEMDVALKNQISHRSKALRGLMQKPEIHAWLGDSGRSPL